MKKSPHLSFPRLFSVSVFTTTLWIALLVFIIPESKAANADNEYNPSLNIRLIQPNGSGINGAKIRILGTSSSYPRMFIRIGSTGGFPTTSTTDAEGHVTLSTTLPSVQRVSVEITATGFAPLRKSNLKTGRNYLLRMQPGGIIKGHITQDSEPLDGIKLVLEWMNQDPSYQQGQLTPPSFKTITDENGAFEFSELPPNERFLLYGRGFSLRKIGYLPDTVIETNQEKQTVDLGDLEVLPGFSISGKLVMKDSSPPPNNVSLRVSTKRDVNGRFIEVSPDGTFLIKGLPPGPCQIRLARANYRIVPSKNDMVKADYQEIYLQDNINDFELLIEAF